MEGGNGVAACGLLENFPSAHGTEELQWPFSDLYLLAMSMQCFLKELPRFGLEQLR